MIGLDDRYLRDETEGKRNAGQDEAAPANDMREAYHSETTAYERLRYIQGKMRLQVLAAVGLGTAPTDNNLSDRQQEYSKIKGDLLEYIQSFNPSDLSVVLQPDSWQEVVDHAVGITHTLGDRCTV